MRISYPERHSEFLSPIENAIQRDKDALFAGTPITVTLPPGGYSGNIQVTIEKTNPHSFWADREYEDPTRFPQRIKVAAWVLFRQSCFGEFEISHESGILTIRMMGLFKKEGKNAEYAAAWNKGVALGNSERYEEAIECFDTAIEIDPRYADAWYSKGVVLANLERYEEAIKCFDKAIEIDPTKNASAWSNKGLVLGKLERYEEAMICCDKAIEIDPRHADAWYHKGVALGELERYEEAIECFDTAIEINPRYADAWYNKGVALGNFEIYEEAIKCFDTAIEIDPRHADAWYFKGLVLTNLERYEEAIECFDTAIEINPRYADAWYYKGVVLGNFEIYEEAIKCFDKAIEIDSNNANAWGNKGYALAGLGKHEEAIECYDTALEVDPNNVLALHNKGDAFLNLKRYGEAIRCCDKTLEIDPNFEEARNNKKIAEEEIKEVLSTVFEKYSLSIERAIYDPCKSDFVEGSFPRMKEWLKRYDPCAYWLVISIQNNTDRAIEEWDVDLEFSSALKIEETKIEGIEIEIPHEAHLGAFKIAVPKEYGIVIPKGGAQRVYFKLRAEKPKTTYEISGVFKSKITGEVPIRPKEFKYLCDTGMPPEAVKAELKKTLSEKEAAMLALSFKTLQEIDRMCNHDAKTEEYSDKILTLKNHTEGFSENFTMQVDEFSRFMEQEQMGYLDDEYKGKVRRLCTNLVDVWISEFLKG